jgi:hypothetical protein
MTEFPNESTWNSNILKKKLSLLEKVAMIRYTIIALCPESDFAQQLAMHQRLKRYHDNKITLS